MIWLTPSWMRCWRYGRGWRYYARGRNLHKTAQLCRDQFDGQLPDDPDSWKAFPGIGVANGQCDCRPGFRSTCPRSWTATPKAGLLPVMPVLPAGPTDRPYCASSGKAADQRTPDGSRRRLHPGHHGSRRTGVHTAASLPVPECPVAADCRARLDERIAELPGKKPRRERPLREPRC